MHQEGVRDKQETKLTVVRRSSLALSITGFIVFLLLTVMVEARLLAQFDLALTAAAGNLESEALDSLSGILSIAFSIELSVALGLLGTLILWRKGFGLRSLAPLAFLPLVLVELLMKAVVHQPLVHAQVFRSAQYPLTTFELAGSFPSGHAIRVAFLCVLLGMFLLRRDGLPARFAVAGLLVLAAVTGFTRVYLGWHWSSDVIAGLVLGGSVAVLVGRAPCALRGAPQV